MFVYKVQMYREHLDEKDPFVPLRFMFSLGSVNMCLYTDILKSLLKIIKHKIYGCHRNYH